MPRSGGLVTATGPEDRGVPADRKRKLPAARQPASTDSVSGAKQQTISELFSASQQKPVNRDAKGSALSPTSKRIRLDPTATAAPFATIPSETTPLPRENMYNFPSNNKNNPVDLTGSATSPPARRPNGFRAKPNFNPHAGAKKLVVKNLRTTPRTDPREYLNQTWERLDKALTAIFNNEEISFSLEELYKGVENCCRQGHAAELSILLKDKCSVYVRSGLKEPLLERTGATNVDLLRAVLAAWATWNRQLKGRSLQEIAVDLFRTNIFNDAKLGSRTVDGACDLVDADRMDDLQDQSTFRDTIKLFHDLSIYTSVFEPRMLHKSQTFIINWSKEASAEKSLADYVHSSVQLMNREMSRCEHYGLDSTTRRDLLTLLETYLIQQQADRLVNQDDIADFLEDNAVNDLEQLYTLLERRQLVLRLREPFVKWIDDTGTAIVFDDKEQEQMVIKLLTLKRQLDTIWRVSFHRNTELGHALRETFEAFINKTKKGAATWNTDNSKPGEMIAKYVDMLLRGGAKAIPAQLSKSAIKTVAADDEDDDVAFDEDSEINAQLDQVLDLFRFVHGKAVFEAFYKKDLARRLLMGRSASADAERSMLARLKTECGAGFTQNLEQMFKDIELAREEVSSYKMLMADRGENPTLDLSVNILSAAAWPTYPDVPVQIPQEIKSAIDRFDQHYKSKHRGRKLDWKHALAHCQLKANFPKGNKEIVVSSFQAIVLLLFNNVPAGEHLSYETIKAETGLPDREIIRTLQSLACAKLRPLTKHPKGKDIAPTDTFTFNTAFTHEKYRVKINQVQLKETKEENKETHERVAADRNFETQAAIVRIMKSRKLISHAELVAEVIGATRSRGVLGVPDIKRNIDRLVDKDYMEREEGNMYSYVA
ncbi:hypothetical protein H2199_007194 [Coniosporium tulheliwenetii]|uniref:Uncharacterized protein n=1 Tax=Coniosporium tulheliwenetii TaxID=3383036 RepID=A0ACC2YQM4_9PEZI|nr:hypothetical protein H2199_007194 [Cladosporium sp. JES 115]